MCSPRAYSISSKFHSQTFQAPILRPQSTSPNIAFLHRPSAAVNFVCIFPLRCIAQSPQRLQRSFTKFIKQRNRSVRKSTSGFQGRFLGMQGPGHTCKELWRSYTCRQRLFSLFTRIMWDPWVCKTDQGQVFENFSALFTSELLQNAARKRFPF